MELDSTVGCTSPSLTPWGDVQHGVGLLGGIQAAEPDSIMCIKPCSQTNLKMSVFVLSYFYVCQKKSEVNKISETIFDQHYYFYINMFRHHREINFLKLWMKTDTW